MTTIEMQIAHVTKENTQLKAEVSQLQGEVHQLLLDIQIMHNRDKERNLTINELQSRCCNCGVGNGG